MAQLRDAFLDLPRLRRIGEQESGGECADDDGRSALRREPCETEREHALAAARHADFLILVFDAMQGVKRTELGLYNELLGLKKPFIIVLNKIDLVEKFKQDVLAKTATNLNVALEQVIPISALKGEGIGQVTLAIIAARPTPLTGRKNASGMSSTASSDS